jgi:hypothetical protein
VRNGIRLRSQRGFQPWKTLSESVDIHMAKENIKQNIKTSTKESLGLCKFKQHKPRCEEECFSEQGKQAKMFYFSGSTAQCGLWPPRITRFLDHTQRRATVGRTPLDELSARRRGL